MFQKYDFVLGKKNTAWKLPKCGGFSGPYFPVFGLNAGKYGPEKNSVFRHFSCSASKTSLQLKSNLDETISIWHFQPNIGAQLKFNFFPTPTDLNRLNGRTKSIVWSIGLFWFWKLEGWYLRCSKMINWQCRYV